MLKERIHGVCLAVFWPQNLNRFDTMDDFLRELIDIFARNEEMKQIESEVLILLDLWPSRYLRVDMAAFRRDLDTVYRVWQMSR